MFDPSPSIDLNRVSVVASARMRLGSEITFRTLIKFGLVEEFSENSLRF